MLRQPITDLSELEASKELVKRLREITDLVQKHERVARVTPKVSSELGDDDRRTSFLQLSHFVSASMNMATDNLLAVRQLLQPESKDLEHHLTAQFPLLRSALESAATALWMLRPDSQRERIRRLLALRLSDVRYDVLMTKAAARVMEGMSQDSVSVTQRGIRVAMQRKKKHIAQLRLIAMNEGIERHEYELDAPGLEEVIKQAAEDNGRAATVWRLISGLTHPSPLRLLQTSQNEEQQDNGDGTSFVLSSMNVQNSTVALLSAMLIYRQATEFRRLRTIRPATR